ncbi:phospholipase A2 inhibitor gamma subunit B-like [Pseudophryne corroboree]|uniref:phospholipase A2 inhibitor gamma subunit B-like n=1 Tax=Pseudophryne corroboree TaxID=495146 RepID=UPI0030813F77
MKFCYIAALSVFVSLIATAQSTTCDLCWVNGYDKCCNVSSLQCPGQCMTVSEYCNVDDRQYRTIQRTCGNPYFCSMNCFSVTGPPNFKVRVGIQCATGDHSNADLDYMVCPELAENGYQCPVCYRNDTLEECSPDGYVKCSGYEKECVNYVAVVQYPDTVPRNVSVKGCVVTGGCNVGLAAIPGTKQMTLIKMECTNAMEVPANNS